VHERVGLAVIALDETEAFHRVEELDRALSLLAGQLALRRTLGSLDRDRLAFDSKVGRGDTAATVHQGELERLPVGDVGKSRLLYRRNVNEHVLAAVLADDEAETLLRIEELHDALPFADDLRRHSAAAGAAETAASTAARSAREAPAWPVAPAEAAAIAEPAAAIIPKAPALLESAAVAEAFLEEPVALVSTASAAVASTPSVETHARQLSLCPNRLQPPRWASTAQPVLGVFFPHTVHSLT
jgi:hypothetical protein